MRPLGKALTVAGCGLALAAAACTPNQHPSELPPGVDVSPPVPAPKHDAGHGGHAAEAGPKQPGAQADGKECTAEDITVSGAPGAEPKVTLPQDCAPPGRVLTKDLSPGRGEGAAPGSTVEANYQLVTWSDRQPADSSWGGPQPQPLRVALGAGQVVPGFEEGLKDIRQGGRRLVVVPPERGYGPQGKPPKVKPDETLVFVIDATRITPG